MTRPDLRFLYRRCPVCNEIGLPRTGLVLHRDQLSCTKCGQRFRLPQLLSFVLTFFELGLLLTGVVAAVFWLSVWPFVLSLVLLALIQIFLLPELTKEAGDRAKM